MTMHQTIIMAAGLGSRLKDLTTAVPKALIQVAGRPLIDYALAFASAAGARHRIVVGGFHHTDVARRVASIAPDASVVENAEFRKGNLLSLLTGVRALDAGGFLLMNTDHVYMPAIAAIVAQSCARAEATNDITAFCDFDRTLGADDMKVRLDAKRRVAQMSKTLPTWECGYVGMTYVPAARRDGYLAMADRVLTTRGDASHVEAILAELAAHGTPPAIADISGHGWLEIDEPHERANAETVLARDGWWA